MGVSSRFLCLTALLSVARTQFVTETDMDPDFYCNGRQELDFFRKLQPANFTAKEARVVCPDYYRCVPAGGNRKKLSHASCGSILFFDVDEQICQIRNKVKNCGKWQKNQEAKPVWPVDQRSSKCPSGEIECGSGECVLRSLFCDENPDCQDGSDENICSDPELDPNAAARCKPAQCKLEQGCFCSVDGTRIPEDLPVIQTPQMITITFTGAATKDSLEVYNQIFNPRVKNNNDCTIKGTFFVSHAFTNYSAVQELHRLGHEISVASVTNNNNKDYWSTLSSEQYAAEFEGARLTTEKFAALNPGEILGMRVPVGRVGGNAQFRMMEERLFLYDSSLSAPPSSKPLWPYTLEHRMPHKCLGTDQKCPTKAFPVWQMVLNSLDRRDDNQFSEQLTGCYYVDQCANLKERKQFRAFLETNLQHHYGTNRAPFGLHFTSSYFLTRRHFLQEFISWIADVSTRGDFYFVSMIQAINWMEIPTELNAINTFEEWKGKCLPVGQPLCSLPSPCGRRPPAELTNENQMYLNTCEECPRSYPWLNDPLGEGFSRRQI